MSDSGSARRAAIAAFCLSGVTIMNCSGATATSGLGTRVKPAFGVQLPNAVSSAARTAAASRSPLAANWCVGRAVETGVEVAQLFHLDRLGVGGGLVEAVRVAHVAARIRIAVAVDPVVDQRFRPLALVLDVGEHLRAHFLQRRRRETGLAQHSPTTPTTGGRLSRRVLMTTVRRVSSAPNCTCAFSASKRSWIHWRLIPPCRGRARPR